MDIEMEIKEKLDIFLITYNRQDLLRQTLLQITDEKSPVKDFHITILDNNSTDKTCKVSKEFCEKFPNIRYVKNNRNIGLGGNICRAAELAQREYFWLLCDNDRFDFSVWNEAEQAINDGKDLIVVSNSFKEWAKTYKNCESECIKYLQCVFCPAAIYKTSYISEDVMVCMMQMIKSVIPHCAIVANILNDKNARIVELKSSIVIQKNNFDEKYSLERINSAQNSAFSEYIKRVSDAGPEYHLMEFLELVENDDLKNELKYLCREVFPYMDLDKYEKLCRDGIKKLSLIVDVIGVFGFATECEVSDIEKSVFKVLRKIRFKRRLKHFCRGA